MVIRRFTILLVFLLVGQRLLAAPEYPAMGSDIFDRKTAGEVLIEQALTQAQKEDKRVVVLFGANWCPWCRRLHRTFTEDQSILVRLHNDFVLVYVDANFRIDKKRNAAVLERYGDPIKKFGLPALVVLEKDGSQLATQETNVLAAPNDTEVAKHVAEFLDHWAPARPAERPR